MRMLLHYACVIGFIVCIAASYCLADIANGTGLVTADNIGWLTSLQYLLAAVFMLGAWLSTKVSESTQHLRWILLAGVVTRLLLIPIDSYTSNDTDRYLWDGIVAAQGHDPYLVSADDPRVSHLRADWPTPPEHAHYATIYPPLAITTFAAVSAIGPDYAPVLWKCLTAIAGLLTLLLAAQLLRRAGQIRHLALVALSPILVLETGVGAHLDIFSTLAITAALLAWQSKRYALVGALLGIGTLFKLLPVVLLLPMLICLGVSRAAMRILVAAMTTLVAGYGSALIIGWQPIGVLPVFLEKWRFGSPLFSALESIFPGTILTALIPALLITGFAIAAFIAKTRPVRSMQWTLSLPLILSPAVFPWYLSVLVPLLALTPSAFLIGWLCVLPLSYEVLGGFIGQGVWVPAQWPLYLLSTVWVLAIGWDYYSTRKHNHQHIY